MIQEFDTMNDKTSTEVKDALDKWHSQRKRLDYLDARDEILQNELRDISKERMKINKDKYTYTDIAVSNHKYWANDDCSMIVKIGNLSGNHIGMEFFVSQKGSKDKKYYSSSLGILMHGDNPISEEEYQKIYDTM